MPSLFTALTKGSAKDAPPISMWPDSLIQRVIVG
jgi:hypothetical protein